jgi:hypothetical protein
LAYIVDPEPSPSVLLLLLFDRMAAAARWRQLADLPRTTVV